MGNGWNKTNPFYSIFMCTFTYDNFLWVRSRPELSEVQCFRTFLWDDKAGRELFPHSSRKLTVREREACSGLWMQFLHMGFHRWELLLINTGWIPLELLQPEPPWICVRVNDYVQIGYIYSRKPRSTWSDMTVCHSEKRGNLLYWTWRNKSHPFLQQAFFLTPSHFIFIVCPCVWVSVCTMKLKNHMPHTSHVRQTSKRSGGLSAEGAYWEVV